MFFNGWNMCSVANFDQNVSSVALSNTIAGIDII